MDIVEKLRDMGGRLRHEAADLIVSLREQLAFAMAHPTEVERTLREQVAALTKERDDRLSPYLYRELKADLLASQAREAAMRSCITDLSGWSDPVLQDVCNEALALPADDTALKERLKKAQVDVLREAAGEEGGYVWRAELRALADELERGKT